MNDSRHEAKTFSIAGIDAETVEFMSVFLGMGNFLWKRHNEVLRKHGLHAPQLGLLYHLSALGPVALTDLMARVPGHLSNIAQIVDRMAKAGWVETRRDQADRRRVLVTPSRKATRTLATIEPFGLQKALISFVSMGARERKKALLAVRTLAELFGLTERDISEEANRHFGPGVLKRTGSFGGKPRRKTGGGKK